MKENQSKNVIKVEDYKKIQQTILKAQEDETPVLIPGEELAIQGDTNKTKDIKTKTYTLEFTARKSFVDKNFPNADYTIKGTTEDPLVSFEFEYDLKPLNAVNAQSFIIALSQIMAFYTEDTEDGLNIIEEDNAEAINKLISRDGVLMLEACSNAVFDILEVSPLLKNCIVPSKLIEIIVNICNDNPDLVNDALVFYN